MVAGPGAAYICDACLQLCNEILDDPTPFSTKALELASRPPVVIAAPQELEQSTLRAPREPVRVWGADLPQYGERTSVIVGNRQPKTVVKSRMRARIRGVSQGTSVWHQ